MRLLLVRHASHGDADGVLTGRLPGRHLTEAGRMEAERLARGLARLPVERVLSSPRERAAETAAAIAAGRELAVDTDAALDEVDFGRWAGRSFAELDHDPDWRRWNAARGTAATPTGDTMAAVGERTRALIGRLGAAHGSGDIVMVTHAELIRATVCDHLGLATEMWARLDIARASVTTLRVDGGTPTLIGLNWKGDAQWD